MGYKVAVVGATGNVGREMLAILAERAFPADEVVALASRRSQGSEVSFGDKTLKVKTLDMYDFSDVDLCLMSAGGKSRRNGRRRSRPQGAIVIDNSSAWRYDSDVPLVVPEVNAEAVRGDEEAASSPTRIARPPSWSSPSSPCTTTPRSCGSWWRPTNPCRAPARTAWTSWIARPRRSTRFRTCRRRSSPSASPST